MIKLTDYIVKRLAEDYGVRHIFMVSGGGAMHLNDSIGKCESIEYVCNHHEQACAIAAEGYTRASGKMGVVCVTSGPGGTNTITGVIGQWLDSVPALYLSGQVKQTTTITACPQLRLRQLGDQEINIVDIVNPVTKMAVMVTNPYEIKKMLDKAIFVATHGRPGPVWLDIPLDVQSVMIDETKLLEYSPNVLDAGEQEVNDSELDALVANVIEQLKKARRPVLMVGQGIRIAGAEDRLGKLQSFLQIPVLTSICGHDLIASEDPLFGGMPGVCGDRIGNVVAQNCDMMLIIGARMGIRQVTYNYKHFAEHAFKVMVDIDQDEMEKPTLSIDLKIHADASRFITRMIDRLDNDSIGDKSQWTEWCSTRKTILPTIEEDNSKNHDFVDLNKFLAGIFQRTGDTSVIVTGNGTAYTSTFQIMQNKKGVRVIANQGCASMGYDLPAAIGACFALQKRPVIVLTGDGSIQMNIQELATLVQYKLPIKMFILDNDGYLAIRTTQDAFFNSNYVASGPSSGVWLPDLIKVAHAYGIAAFKLEKDCQVGSFIETILATDGPVLGIIKMDPKQTLFPKVASVTQKDGSIVSKPLEDMYPFLKPEILCQCYWND